MKHLFSFVSSSLVALTLFSLVGCSGCGSTPKPPINKEKDPAKLSAANVFQPFLASVRYPENPRSTDDWSRFRDALTLLNSHFASADSVARMRLTAEDRAFLEKTLHLTDAEMSELESITFRPADAHYLDECFLLRDAARALEVPDLSNIDRAEDYFEWVMRNVYLHEQGVTWTPPAFALRRGHGGAIERAMIFLALIRQANYEGCLIVVPEANPTRFLAAVMLPTSGGSKTTTGGAATAKAFDFYLFDTRLGLPVRGKDGVKIATLQDVLEQPKLLEPSGFTPEDVKKLEAWLVCPLQALSPRMRELQPRLSAFDTIVLYLDAERVAREVASCKLPVKAWNDAVAPESKGPPSNSPTRCLRQFLPKSEGGIDELERARFVQINRLPFDQVRIHYAEINVQPELMPKLAFDTLMSITQDLFLKFDVQPRELFLRGMHEPMNRRRERLRAFAKDEVLVGLADDKAFRADLAEWQKLMRDAASANPDDPQAFAKAQKNAQSLMFQDQFLGWMLDVQNERKLERDQKKSVLTGILAIGTRDYFDSTLARQQACQSHEKAALAQTRLKAMAKPPRSRIERTAEAWSMARSAWSNFYLDRIALEYSINQRLEQWRTRLRPENVLLRLGLLESMHRDIHQYFDAKLRLAECIERLDGAKQANLYLAKVEREIDDLEKKNLFTGAFESIRSSLANSQIPPEVRGFLDQRLDLLARDWGKHGAFYWYKQHIRQRRA